MSKLAIISPQVGELQGNAAGSLCSVGLRPVQGEINY